MLAAALAAAAAWQLTRWKAAALRACQRTVPLLLYGRCADAAVVRNGGACVGSCWAAMLAMDLASGAAMLPVALP